MKNLHDQIVNLPCQSRISVVDSTLAYKYGHRDARHAAAELVSELEEQRDELLTIMKEIPGWIGGEWSDRVRAAVTKAEAA